MIELTLTVNGRERTAPAVPASASLLTALRDHLALPGSKNACEQGECGSCTVYLDGEPVCSCLVAAGQAQGRDVRTIEGLAGDGGGGAGGGGTAAGAGVGDGFRALDAVQRAFIECGAVQCGFCTPGLIVAAHDLIHRTANRDDAVGSDGRLDQAVIREALAGNLCRCTGYEKIIEAVRRAADEVRGRTLT